MTHVLAIDLGGTNLRAAVHRGNARTLEQLCREPAPKNLDAFVARIGVLCAEAVSVDALGLAVPGLVEGSVCRWIPNLPYLDGVDVEALFPGLRVAVGNDAQFAMLAEAVEGSAKGMSDAILLAIGTGIGSAVLANRRIVVGGHGGACSFGWACADAEDPGESRNGWLERVASGRALDALARQIGLADGGKLIENARAGDRTALAALETPGRRLGTALAGVVALLDPQAILISGGLADAMDVMGPPLLSALRCQLPPHLRNIVLRPSQFGSRASLVGAALAGLAGKQWRQIG